MMSNIGLRCRMRNQEDLAKVTCKLRPEECRFKLDERMFYTESSRSVHGCNPDQTVKAEEFGDKSRDQIRSIRHAQEFGSL